MFVSHFKDYRSGQEKKVVRSHEWMKTMGKNLGDRRGQGYILENYGISGRVVMESAEPWHKKCITAWCRILNHSCGSLDLMQWFRKSPCNFLNSIDGWKCPLCNAVFTALCLIDHSMKKMRHVTGLSARRLLKFCPQFTNKISAYCHP